MGSQAAFWIRCGAVMGGLAVALGAFGAHGLGDILLRKYDGQVKLVMGEEIPAANKYLTDFQTAATYQMSHALALLAVGLLPPGCSSRCRSLAGWSFLIGILLFSGSLYVLAVTGITKLGMVTPFGGVSFLIGWTALLMSVCGKSVEPAGSRLPLA